MATDYGTFTWPPSSGSGGGGMGTVTSVGLSLPAEFNVSGSPVTTSGTLTATWASEAQNLFLASPNGSSGTPSFRAIVAADVPTLNQNTTGTSSNVTGIVALVHGGTGVAAGSANAAFNTLSPLTTKGDLIGFSTINARLPVGTDGQVLSADSSQTTGLKWVTPGGGGSPGGSNTQVQFNDSGSFGGSAGLVYDKTNKALSPQVLVLPTGGLQQLSDNSTIDSSYSYAQVTIAETTPGTPQQDTVTAIAATTLASKSFTIQYAVGYPSCQASSDVIYTWYKVSGVGTDPGTGTIPVEVDVLSTDNAATVAAATRAALAPYSAFFTVSGSSDQIIITQVQTVSGGASVVDVDTGFGFSTTVPEVDPTFSDITLDSSSSIAPGIFVGQTLKVDFKPPQFCGYANNKNITIPNLSGVLLYRGNDVTVRINGNHPVVIDFVYDGTVWVMGNTSPTIAGGSTFGT